MCVIMYKPVGVKALDTKWLQNAVDANTDGWGVVVRSKDGVMAVQKGFQDPAFLEFASSYGEDYDVVAHARIATSGTRDVTNLHPFPIYAEPAFAAGTVVGAEPVAYLLHNGIVSVPEWDKTKSDTWHLARIWENTYGGELNTKMRQRGWRRRQKKRFAANYPNKFVLVDKEGVAIINPTAGLWAEGVWHSNRSALDDPWKYTWSGQERGQCASRFLTGGNNRRLLRDGYDEEDENYGYGKDYTESSEFTLSNGDTYEKWSDGSWRQKGKYDARPFGEELSKEDMESLDPEDKALIDALEERMHDEDIMGVRTEMLLQEWIKDNRISSIENTIFNVDSDVVSHAIKELLRSSGMSSRLGQSE